jgi:hypothetical protein
MIDVAGTITFPVPSLDSALRTGGRAARRLGVTRTTGRVDRLTIGRNGITGAVKGLQPSRSWFRDAREFPPGDRPPPTSSRGCTRSRGVRVHRGEPLLLGVDEEYQISYRLFGGKTAEMVKIRWEASMERVWKKARSRFRQRVYVSAWATEVP